MTDRPTHSVDPASAGDPRLDGRVPDDRPAPLGRWAAPSRRQAITWIAVGGIGALAVACRSSGGTEASSPTTTGGSKGTSGAGGSTGTDPACVLTPEMTQGPYYLDDGTERRDITEGRPGAPLALALAVVDASTCQPIRDAVVDIWHCDAGGIYSGFVGTSTSANGGDGGSGTPSGGQPPGGPGGGFPGGPGGTMPSGGPGGAPPAGAMPGGGAGGPGRDGQAASASDDSRFLRGWQRTDADGVVRFATVYPGWYTGRTVHIHVKVHLGDDVVHTGQLFFDEAQTDAVYQREPYASHAGSRLRNDQDSIYQGGGSRSIVAVTTEADDQFSGTLTMGVQRTAANPV